MSLSKLKIRVATLWVMLGAAPSDTSINDRTVSNEVVQLHHLSNEKLHQQSPHNVNTILLKKLHNQSRRKRKKRKRKEGSESSSNLYYFKNHSYNHITDNNNGDHIIKNNSNEARRRRKVKSIDLIGSNKLSRSRIKRKENHHEKNITLWIFRIKKPIDRLNGTINIDDDVRLIMIIYRFNHCN